MLAYGMAFTSILGVGGGLFVIFKSLTDVTSKQNQIKLMQVEIVERRTGI